jgi:hypothetical protein
MAPGVGPEADKWFVNQGLPWFVPERRQKAHRALHSKHTLAGMVVIAVLALALGIVLAYLTDELSVAPATMVTLIVLATFLYAGRELGAWPIAKWAIGRTMRSLRLLFPMVTRALPLLLLFMTFLFINAEVWQVSATLDGGVLWVTVLLFSFIALAFLLTRLPEELDHVDDEADESSVVEVCRGTPLAEYAQSVLDADDSVARLAERTKVHGMEKANLLLVLIVTQALQVLLLSVSVFAFFVVFGAVIMKHGVQEAWTASTIHALPYATNLSVELLQVSVFLAAFSGLYFTVYGVSGEAWRDQFCCEIGAVLGWGLGVGAGSLVAGGGASPAVRQG